MTLTAQDRIGSSSTLAGSRRMPTLISSSFESSCRSGIAPASDGTASAPTTAPSPAATAAVTAIFQSTINPPRSQRPKPRHHPRPFCPSHGDLWPVIWQRPPERDVIVTARRVTMSQATTLPCRANHPDASAHPASSERGVRVVTNVEAGCDGHGRCARRAQSTWTAKSCGPGAPELASSLRCSLTSTRTTGAIKPVPRRSRISRKTVARGRPDVGRTCGSAACFFVARGPWVRPAPDLPRALSLSRVIDRQSSDAKCAARARMLALTCKVMTQRHTQLSSSAKAGDPVRRGLSINHNRLVVLDRPVKPGDDSGGCGALTRHHRRRLDLQPRGLFDQAHHLHQRHCRIMGAEDLAIDFPELL